MHLTSNDPRQHDSPRYKQMLSRRPQVVTSFTSAGILVVMDLHWNFRSLSQTSMALADNSVEFWESIATKYGGNPLVFYELYNEPMLGESLCPSPWRNTASPHHCTLLGCAPCLAVIATLLGT